MATPSENQILFDYEKEIIKSLSIGNMHKEAKTKYMKNSMRLFYEVRRTSSHPTFALFLKSNSFEDFIKEAEDMGRNFDEINEYISSSLETIERRLAYSKKQKLNEIELFNKAKKLLINKDHFLRDQLFTINSMYPFDKEKQAFKLPKYILENDNGLEIEFDGLFLKFNFKDNNVYKGVTVISSESSIHATDSNGRRFYHPHINCNGQICYGQGEQACKSHWELRDSVSIAIIVNEILSNYNGESPYIPLYKWEHSVSQINTTHECESCGDVYPESELVIVGEDSFGCHGCTEYSELDQETYWKDKVVYSKFHESFILKEESIQINSKDPDFIKTDDLEATDNPFILCDTCEIYHHKNSIKNHSITVEGCDPIIYNICDVCIENQGLVKENNYYKKEGEVLSNDCNQ